MTQHITKTSPRFLARMAGLFFLLTILGGIFAQGFVSERLIDFTNAAATATNILTHKSMFQLGFTVYLIEMACQVATAALFYVLLRPVSKSIALTAAFLELTGCIIKGFCPSLLHHSVVCSRRSARVERFHRATVPIRRAAPAEN